MAHSKKQKRVEKTKFEKLDQAVKFAGGVAGLLTAIIKIIEFASQHFRPDGKSDVFSQWEAQEEIEKIPLECESYLQNGMSDTELASLANRITGWFNNLPPDVRAENAKQFGESYIAEVRNAFYSSRTMSDS